MNYTVDICSTPTVRAVCHEDSDLWSRNVEALGWLQALLASAPIYPGPSLLT